MIDPQEQGVAVPARATHEQSQQAVSAVPVGIANADWLDVLRTSLETQARLLDAEVKQVVEARSRASWGGAWRIEDGLSAASFIAQCSADRLYFALMNIVEAIGAAQGIEAQRAETGTGSVHESPIGNADAP